MTALAKRMVIRLTDDLDAWIGEQAEREGLDNATWARAVLTRLKNGLSPMAGAAPPQRVVTAQPQPHPQSGIDPNEPSDPEALLEYRLTHASETIPDQTFVTAPPAADDLSHERIGVAIPLRRIERSRYNPGRTGYG